MSWEQIQGHVDVTTAFARAVERNRLAHAYLFLGLEGIGKRMFAGELAKALLCERSDQVLNACGECKSCKLVEAGTHPDFFSVSRPENANEVPIEVMRELCGNFTLRTARGKGKVAILEDADDLNPSSANCFLKTLEEPPPRSVFILIGTSLDRQLPTIVSRCQVVRFQPLAEATVEELLHSAELPPDVDLGRLAKLSGGSPGQALLLADPDLWKFRRDFVEAVSQPRIDTPALSQSLLKFAEEAGKESASQRRRAALFLRLMIDFFRDALAVSLGRPPRFADSDDEVCLQSLANQQSPETLIRVLDRCFEAEFHFDRYVQLALAVEAFVDGLGQILLRR